MIRKVLFVDDDQILQVTAGNSLSAYGEHFSVVMASDGFEAVKKLEEQAFSLVVVDLIMPRMNGMSLLAHMKDIYPDIPTIVISALPPEEMKNIAEGAGILSYFSKPFQTEHLVRVIMSTLRNEANGGIMHDVSPTVFLQLVEMDAKTCTIRVLDKASLQGGILHFIDGQLVDARIGELRGLKAAHTVFSWDLVTIFIGKECAPREDIVNSDLQTIIMTAVGLKDEAEEEPDDSLSEEGIRNLLQEKVGEKCEVEDVAKDVAVGSACEILSKIATSSEFGEFKVGYLCDGQETDRLILAKKPTTVLSLRSGCPQDEVIDTLLNS